MTESVWLYVPLCFGISLIPIMIIVGIRDIKATRLRMDLINKCYKIDSSIHTVRLWDVVNKELPSKDKMIFSFKKIKIENYLSPYLVKLLNEN